MDIIIYRTEILTRHTVVGEMPILHSSFSYKGGNLRAPVGSYKDKYFKKLLLHGKACSVSETGDIIVQTNAKEQEIMNAGRYLPPRFYGTWRRLFKSSSVDAMECIHEAIRKHNTSVYNDSVYVPGLQP